MDRSKEWFGEWFDSPYYHILYKNRDHHEAQLFIDNLVKYLFVNAPQEKILDLACGKGRHAIYLHKLGYNVTGIDLSNQNIEFAKRFSRRFGDERLQFYVHDMREVFAKETFDYVLNIFTSFGYFEKAGENKQAIQAAAANLKKGGKLVIDFFNTEKIIENLVASEIKLIENIQFSIQKKVESGFIVKNISFEDNNHFFQFKEKVKCLTKNDFLNYFDHAGLKILDCFGDYELNKFDPKSSERMIFITQK